MNKILKAAGVVAVSVAFAVLLLVCSAFLPQNRIRTNMASSAHFLCEHEVFFNLHDTIDASRVDRYADSILLNIAYHFDRNDALSSTIKSAYYYTPYQNENLNLKEAVRSNLPANQQYLRYWHGPAAMVRLFHVFTDIRGMYLANGILLIALVLALIGILMLRRQYAAALCTAAALIAGSIWYVPLSLEYTWTVLLALGFSIYTVIVAATGSSSSGSYAVRLKKPSGGTPPESQIYNSHSFMFLIAGITTCYFDFLSTETLTLLMPLMLMTFLEQRRERAETGPSAAASSSSKGKLRRSTKKAPSLPPLVGRTISRCIYWGAGYVLMWLTKWGLASLVMHENALSYVTDHAAQRLGGDVGVSLAETLLQAIVKNVGCLFPLGYFGIAGIAATPVLIVIWLCRWFVYRTGRADRTLIITLAALGLIPFIRYLVLHNHSYIHYFFTYRALMATILAAGLILAELTGAPLTDKPG